MASASTSNGTNGIRGRRVASILLLGMVAAIVGFRSNERLKEFVPNTSIYDLNGSPRRVAVTSFPSDSSTSLAEKGEKDMGVIRLKNPDDLELAVKILKREGIVVSYTHTSETVAAPIKIASRTQQQQQQQQQSSDVGSCHFEQGHGQFLGNLAEGNWTWTPHQCSDAYVDYLVDSTDLGARGNKEKAVVDKYGKTQSKIPPLTKHLNIISIGDSLSRNQAEQVSDEWLLPLLPYMYDIDPNETIVARNRAKWKATSIQVWSKNVTTSRSTTAKQDGPSTQKPSVSIASFGIFGMHKPCWNGNIAVNVDSREYNTTVERIQSLLKPEVLDRLPKQQPAADEDVHNVYLVHSALWDISTGCNDHATILPEFAANYKQAILDINSLLQQMDPSATIYWRTGPPLSSSYDARSVANGRGRSRANQNALNQIIRETVRDESSSVVIDWWNQIERSFLLDNNSGSNSNNITSTRGTEWLDSLIPDGMHYARKPSLASFNLFLNTLFDREPELLRSNKAMAED